jgi:1-acyl-sn-glycerol-3-phosphate acyltransferase
VGSGQVLGQNASPHPEAAAGAVWMPLSPCGERCYPAGSVSSWWRLAARSLGLLLVGVLVLISAPLLVVASTRVRSAWLSGTARLLLGVMGIRLRVRGARRFGERGVLVVANHMSWIEALALAAVQPVRLVAKREVRGWFLIGAIAAATGVLFIDREALRRLPGTLADMAGALRSGQPVAVFPEGTTWCGTAAGPFRSAAFQAALDADVPVRPVAITLRSGGRVATEAAYIGGRNLLGSVGAVLALCDLVCELTLLPVLTPRGDRAELARRAASVITEVTGVAHPPRSRRPAGVPR